jgi:hypothetical protein
MQKHLCCDTLTRRIRVGWISFQPKGDISVGLHDKAYIAPQIKAQHFVWSAYSRSRISYVLPSDPSALEQVKNPHFTYHAMRHWFHLKPSKKKHGDTLFEAIADIPLTLHQDSWMPWIRAVSSPIRRLASGGRRPGRIIVDELTIQSGTEDVSIRIEIDFVTLEYCKEPPSGGWEWAFAWEKVGVRVRLLLTNPQIATLGWFHLH